MDLRLIREVSSSDATHGVLFIDGRYECFTLEDVVRPEKIAGETAIPSGRYQITITQSPRFRRPLPLLHDVPEFRGIRIHPGNTALHTAGCLLVGQGRTPNRVTRSRKAMEALQPKLAKALADGDSLWSLQYPWREHLLAGVPRVL
jgi:hypothetical protein